MPSFWDRFRSKPIVKPSLDSGHTFFSVTDPPPGNYRVQELTWEPTGAPVQGSRMLPDVYFQHVVGTAFFEQWQNQPVPGGGSDKTLDSYPPNIRPIEYYAPQHYRGLDWQLQRIGGGGVSRPPGIGEATAMYKRNQAIAEIPGKVSDLYYSSNRSSDRSPDEVSLLSRLGAGH